LWRFLLKQIDEQSSIRRKQLCQLQVIFRTTWKPRAFSNVLPSVQAGVGNQWIRRRMRLFGSSEVTLSGFDKTWNLILHLLMITIRIKLSTINLWSYEVTW